MHLEAFPKGSIPVCMMDKHCAAILIALAWEGYLQIRDWCIAFKMEGRFTLPYSVLPSLIYKTRAKSNKGTHRVRKPSSMPASMRHRS